MMTEMQKTTGTLKEENVQHPAAVTLKKSNGVGEWLKDKTSNVSFKQWQFIIELAVVLVVILIVWGLLSLPIIFYLLPQNQRQIIGSNGTNSQVRNISNFRGDFDLENGTGPGVCVNNYTGSLCHSALLSCESFENDSDVFLSNSVLDQTKAENEIGGILYALDLFIKPSDKCRNAVVPFLCLYTFGLCGENGIDYGPAQAQCSEIRDTICKSEWKEASTLLESYGQPTLPDCSSLSDDGLNCGVINSNDTQCTIKCHDHFYCDNNFCKPRCDRFREYSDTYTDLSDGLTVASGCVGILCGIVVLVIFCVRYKQMMLFPTVLVLYLTITLLVFESIAMIGYIGRTRLFCNSLDLLENIEHPTAFCQLTGGVLYYMLLQAFLWWIFHVLAIFWKVHFPMHSRYYDKMHRTRYIHVTCVIVALTLPMVPLIPTSINGGFIMPRFPPVLCVGRDADSSFYSFVIPIVLLIGAGTNLLVLIFWRIRRHMLTGLSHSRKSKSPIQFGPAERKVFLVFLYYMTSGALVLTTYSLATRRIDYDVESTLSYFNCQRSGHNSTCSLDRVQNPVWSLMSFIVIGLFPTVNLVFAMRSSDVKMVLGKIRNIFVSRKRTVVSSNVTVSEPSAETSVM